MNNIFSKYIDFYSLDKNKYISYLKKHEEITPNIFLKLQIPIYYLYDFLNIFYNKVILNYNLNLSKFKELPYSICNNSIQTEIYYYLQYIGFDIQKYYIFNDFNSFNIKYPEILKKIENDMDSLLEANIETISSFLLITQYFITEMNNIIFNLINCKLKKNFKKKERFIIKHIENNLKIYSDLFKDIFNDYNINNVEMGAILAIKVFDNVLSEIYKSTIMKKSLAICAN